MAKPGRKKKAMFDPEQPTERPAGEAPPPPPIPEQKIVTESEQKSDDIEPIDSFLPKKDLFRIDEVARYFDVTEQTIRLWIQHNHLIAEKVRGTLRIQRASILSCRFRSKVA